jgi:hypothetical protein
LRANATIDLQGFVASGLALPLMSWCLRERGPLYVAMFGPLIIVFVAVLSSIFLDETLHPCCAHTDQSWRSIRFYWGFSFLLFSFSHGRCGGCHFCSALGAVLIVAGLYMVLWGKTREVREKAAGVQPEDEELGKESTAPAAAAAAANGEAKCDEMI